MATRSEILAEIPFFALLDESERATLAERLDVVSVSAGTILWHRGDPGDAMYIVKRGVVEIWVRNDTGEKLLLEIAREGDFFGDVSLLDGGPRTATAEVKEDLEALVVDRGDLDEFFRLRPAAALDLLTSAGKRLRETALLLRRSASRNINEETEDKRTQVMKIADWISEFSGSLPFLFIHVGLFLVWIVLNIAPFTRWFGFDPFPFGLLTMVVSLEAIILSVFVLLSQNRQAERDRVRNEIEYQVNLRAELEIAHLHEKMDHTYGEIMVRMNRLEASLKSVASKNL